MNEVIKTIKERRSIRSYLDKPVEKEKINKLIECAGWGPTAKDMQNLRFIVVTNKDTIRKISNLIIEEVSELYPQIKERAKEKKDPVLYSAPLFIAVAAQADSHWNKIDGSIAAQNMVLAAHSLGLGSCYIGMTRTLKENPKFNELLRMPDGYRVVITIVFGYAAEKPEPKERKEDNLLWID